MKNLYKYSASALLAISLFGGCSSDSTSSATSETGYFLDAPVENLSYATSSGLSGATDIEGRFQYRVGDTVKFSIGNLVLGESAPNGDNLITPTELAQNDANLTTTILRLLQSLDSDSNTSNGITISQVVIDDLKNNLSNIRDIKEFNDDSEILSLSTTLADDLDENNDGAIDVDSTEALRHFENTMLFWNSPDDDYHDDNDYSTMSTYDHEIDIDSLATIVLTDAQKYALAYMWNEEKMAKDIYLALNELYPTRQFEYIASNSEEKHQEMVQELVKKYDLNITNLVDYSASYSEAELEALPAGEFGVTAIQDLYDTLYTEGKTSKIDALKVGCKVEVTDVDDLDTRLIGLDTNSTDVGVVFNALRNGSYMHYWAFDRALKAEGVDAGCASLGDAFSKTIDEYSVK